MEEKHSKATEDRLDQLLKMVDLQQPSENFSDRVMAAHASEKTHQTFRSIKVPLFLMGLLALLMFLPWIMSMQVIIPETPKSQLLDFINGLSSDFSIWYLVCPVALLLSLAIVVLIEMRTINLHKSNTPVI